MFFRIDLTENKIYTLSEASRRVVSTLSEPLTIKVFFTKNLPAPHNNTERYIHDLFEEYSISANQYLNYRFYDVSADEGDISPEAKKNQELANNYGIYPVQLNLIEKDEIKFIKAYMGIVLIHGDLIERIPAVTTTDKLEYRLTSTIRKMNNKISALLSLSEKIQVKLFLSSSLKVVAPFMRLDKLNEILDTDENARYVGEFSLGVNPYILHPMKDTLFDEKIKGSIHLTPGCAYDEAPNGNISAIHWDLVLIQRKEYGGGEIWFDDVLIRKDGKFTLEQLKPLNQENWK